MLWLLALSLLSAATIGSVMAYQRGMAARLPDGTIRRAALPPAREDPAVERTLQTLQVGDVVVEGDEDWLITATATYREEEEVWWVHLLEDGKDRRFMEVRRRPGWTVTMLQAADDVPTFGQLGHGLTFRAQPYQLERRGDARVSLQGERMATGEGLLRYATYAGPAGTWLNVEEQEGRRLAFAGQTVEPTGLMLMPGARPEADPLADLD